VGQYSWRRVSIQEQWDLILFKKSKQQGEGIFVTPESDTARGRKFSKPLNDRDVLALDAGTFA
jgi:hypothetical protein